MLRRKRVSESIILREQDIIHSFIYLYNRTEKNRTEQNLPFDGTSLGTSLGISLGLMLKLGTVLGTSLRRSLGLSLELGTVLGTSLRVSLGLRLKLGTTKDVQKNRVSESTYRTLT
jgi:hypothetical protein